MQIQNASEEKLEESGMKEKEREEFKEVYLRVGRVDSFRGGRPTPPFFLKVSRFRLNRTKLFFLLRKEVLRRLYRQR